MANLVLRVEYDDHQTNMLSSFFTYLCNESMVDVMLQCDGNIIKAHKMVLSAGSPYFRNIFDNIKNPMQLPVIIVKDMPFRDLTAIVEFLYKGEVVVPMDQAESLSRSAQTLFIKGLVEYFNSSANVNITNADNRNNIEERNSNTGLSPRKPPVLKSQTPARTQTSPRTTTTPSTQEKATTSTNPRPSQAMNSSNNKKLKAKTSLSNGSHALSNDSKTTSMRLRNKRRPDYRQLSNGDFSSDDDSVNEIEMHDNQVNLQYSRRTYSKVNRDYIIKKELLQNYEQEIENNFAKEPKNVIKLSQTNNNVDENPIDDQTPSTSTRLTPVGQLITNKLPITSRKSIRQPEIKPIMTSTPRINEGSAPDVIEETGNHLNDGQLHRCAECPRIFSNIVSLKTHLKRIHNQEIKDKHECRECGKEYSWRSGLYKHMRVHKSKAAQK